MVATVKQLIIYPIKGCKGIDVAYAPCYETGLPYDRQWMVVAAGTGKFITQRQIPKLCQVAVSLPPEALMGDSWGKLQPGAALVLAAPGMPQLQVPLAQCTATQAQLRHLRVIDSVQHVLGGAEKLQRQVTVWEWTGIAADEGDEAAAWFSQYLERPLRLVRHLHSSGLPSTVRSGNPEFAPNHPVKFADGFPLLVALEESLDALNKQLNAHSTPIPMNRFRPNIIISGADLPWVDDTWSSIAIGSSTAAAAAAAGSGGNGAVTAAGVVLQYVKPCSRCKVTTVNQTSAEVGAEPLKTLAQTRSGKVLGWSEQRKAFTHEVFFGWNAAVMQLGSINVGDVVTVLQDRLYSGQ